MNGLRLKTLWLSGLSKHSINNFQYWFGNSHLQVLALGHPSDPPETNTTVEAITRSVRPYKLK